VMLTEWEGTSSWLITRSLTHTSPLPLIRSTVKCRSAGWPPRCAAMVARPRNFVRRLPAQTAVAIYSVHRLALSGPGMTVEHLPAGLGYHYRYQGLRLLIARSGTYYLLPVGWNPRQDLTYILNESDQIRIELLSGVQHAS